MNTTPTIKIATPLATQILAEAQASKNKEICGLIAAKNGTVCRLYPIDNCATNPAHHYLMNPQQQIQAFKAMRERHETLYGIYHSHPRGPATPSTTDIKTACYAEAIYFIVSMNTKGVLELRAFQIYPDSHFKELALNII